MLGVGSLSAALRLRALAAVAAAVLPLATTSLEKNLRSLVFLNSGTVRATDSFQRLTQCNGFTECYTTWHCPSAPGSQNGPGPGCNTAIPWNCQMRDPLYLTTAGSPGVPPVGMRSAVPLGGLGTGTFELRADGSFADWQIENQGPALATDKDQNSKIPVLSGAFLGLRLGSVAVALQTHPSAGLPAAEMLTYSGAYPFSRHTLNDSRLPRGLSAEVFSFSAVKLHDENKSALPAVTFTLVLENSGESPVNGSFLLSLPLASTAFTTRRDDASTIRTLRTASAEQCLQACNADAACTYWQVDTRPKPATAAVPAVPAQVKPDHDCPDPNLGPGELRKAFRTIEECYGYCNATRYCNGFVWDTVASELGPTGQCPPHGAKPGQGCCILKAKPCSNFVAKKGDSAVSYGAPSVPAQPAMLGAGCTLHSGAPAVQQFFPNSSVASGVKGTWSVSKSASGATELRHKRSNNQVSAPLLRLLTWPLI